MLEYDGAAGMSEAASEITFEDRRSVPASLTLSALRRKMEKGPDVKFYQASGSRVRCFVVNMRSGFGFDARTLRDERIMTDGSIPVRNFILC